MGVETGGSIPKDTRLSLLFSIPSQAFLNLSGDLPPFPIEIKKDDWKTTWDQKTTNSIGEKPILLTIREDTVGERKRDIEIGETTDQSWVSFTVMDGRKVVALRFVPQGEVNGLSAYVQAPKVSGELANCSFHYNEHGVLGEAGILISPDEEEEDEETSTRKAIEYMDRPLDDKLREYSHIFTSLIQEMHDAEPEDDEVNEDEEVSHDSLIAFLGINPEHSEAFFARIREIIDEELTKVHDDSFDQELIPALIEDLLGYTLFMLGEAYEDVPEEKRTDPSFFSRELIVQALGNALAVRIATEVSVMEQKKETGIDLDFVSDDCIIYEIFEINPITGMKKVLSSEVKPVGEEFRHFFYTVETHCQDGKRIIDVKDIRGKTMNRFVGPSQVNIQRFYEKVSNPFTDGTDALDVVDMTFEEMSL